MTELSRRTVLGGMAGAAVLTGVPFDAAADEGGGITPVGLTTDHLTDPLGIGAAVPRFGWRLTAGGSGRTQTAYRIVVATDPGLRDRVWDSGRVASSGQTGRRYGGPALRSGTRYHWAVRAWDERGRSGPASRVAWFETALLSDRDWTADWVGSGLEIADPPRVLEPGETSEDPLAPGHTLGQLFTAKSRMVAVTALLNVPADQSAGCVMTLRHDGPDGAVVARRELAGLRGDAYGGAQARTDLAEPTAPGIFFVELSSPQGRVGWQTATHPPPQPDPDGAAYADGKEVPDKDRWVYGIAPPPPANPLLRKEFRLPGEVVSARLYLSGLGKAVAWVNGRRVGEDVLSPVATDYDRRLLFTTHDVTGLLRTGDNAIGVALGRGFFATRAPDGDGTNLARWTAEPQLRAQLVVTLAGGRRITVGTGTDWTYADGPTTYEGVHAGESYNARLAAGLNGWSAPGFDADGWRPVVVVPSPGGVLEAYPGEPIRIGGPVRPVRVTRPADGVRVLDFGVVLTGWVRLRGRLPAGTRIRLQYGEKLGPDGRVHTGTPGGVENPSVDGRFQLDEYTAAGRGIETWQPSFTYKGFQYVEVTGAPASLDLVAVPVASELADTMDLDLDHPQLQWIADAFRQTALNGLHGYPDLSPMTMVGWLGATRNAAQPMLYQFGTARLFEHWLDDIRAAQAPSGALPLIAPLGADPAPFLISPVYTSLYPHLVRRHWQMYGDRAIPAAHLEPVRRYLDWLTARLAEQGDLTDDAFGDWYPPGKQLGDHPRGAEGGRLVGTAYAIQSLRDGVVLADLLGRTELARRWRSTAERVTARFTAEFLDTAAGVYRTETPAGYRQASNAIPLALGLVPDRHVAAVVANLVADVERRGRHFDTGSMGTGALAFALSEHGRSDLAVAVLGQTSYPSYGHLRSLGATTLWESWEPHSRGHNDTTTSAPVTWLVERAAGVEALEPGWARFRVAPTAYDSLPAASIALDTVRGRVGVHWRRNGRELVIVVTVPVNAVAEVALPDGRTVELGSGRHRVTCAVG